jgi:Pterin binding enzyme
MHAVQAAGAATRVVTDPAAVWDGICRFFARRLTALQAAGIGRDRLIIDPGLGYFLGSTPGPSLAALAGIRELKATFGVPVLISPSRKSFLRALAGKDVTRSGPATLAAEIFAAWQGADYIRTHDVPQQPASSHTTRHPAAPVRQSYTCAYRRGRSSRTSCAPHHPGASTPPSTQTTSSTCSSAPCSPAPSFSPPRRETVP